VFNAFIYSALKGDAHKGKNKEQINFSDIISGNTPIESKTACGVSCAIKYMVGRSFLWTHERIGLNYRF